MESSELLWYKERLSEFSKDELRASYSLETLRDGREIGHWSLVKGYALAYSVAAKFCFEKIATKLSARITAEPKLGLHIQPAGTISCFSWLEWLRQQKIGFEWGEVPRPNGFGTTAAIFEELRVGGSHASYIRTGTISRVIEQSILGINMLLGETTCRKAIDPEAAHQAALENEVASIEAPLENAGSRKGLMEYLRKHSNNFTMDNFAYFASVPLAQLKDWQRGKCNKIDQIVRTSADRWLAESAQ